MPSKDSRGPQGTHPHPSPNDGTMILGRSPSQGVLGAKQKPLERPPKYAFLSFERTLSYRPSGNQIASWHTVLRGKGESFRTIAAQYGLAVDQLIELNFPGSVENGQVVHEGFHCPDTEDGENRRFQGGEKLAIPKGTIIELCPMKVTLGVEELMVHATDDPVFTTLAADFEKESSKHKAEPVNGPTEIPAVLDGYFGLKQINFYTHGTPGHLHFGNHKLHKGIVPVILEAHDSLFQSGKGRVLFIGCNVGEGAEGRDFLIAVGQALLKGHGGYVGATTAKNASFPFPWGITDARMPLWAISGSSKWTPAARSSGKSRSSRRSDRAGGIYFELGEGKTSCGPTALSSSSALR